MNVKRILVSCIAIFALAVSSTNAQPGGGMGGGMGGPGGGMGGPGGRGPGGGGMGMMDPIKSNGLFMIDSADAIKSLKIKEKSTTNDVKDLLNEYQKTYDTLTVELSEEIKSIESTVAKMKEMRQGQQGQQGGATVDREAMREQMTSMREKAEVIREKALEMHKALNSGLQSTITVDSYKKWVRYYNGICADNFFSLERRERPQRNGEEGGQGQGRRRE